MAYNDQAVTDLRASIQSMGSALRKTLDALDKTKGLIVPKLAADSQWISSSEPVIWSASSAAARQVMQDALDDLAKYADGALADYESLVTQAVNLGIQPAALASLHTPSAPFQCLKNWSFGTDAGNTIQSYGDLDEEFDYHDQFGQVSNGGGNYGAVTVASSPLTAIPVYEFALPPQYNGIQPVDQRNSYAYRQWTANSMIANTRSLNGPTTSFGPASQHTGGCGSLVAKFRLPASICHGAGRKDIAFETKCRFKSNASFDGNPAHAAFPAGYWSAAWTCGALWDGGPEMDIYESYSDTVPSGLRNGNAFHVNSVGGTDVRFPGGESWWSANGMVASGMPGVDDWGPQQLTKWHTFVWAYYKDDTYEVWIDDPNTGIFYKFQYGTLVWTVPQGGNMGLAPDMVFLWDFTALHSGIAPINTVVVPPADQPMQYEIAMSRVYTRT